MNPRKKFCSVQARWDITVDLVSRKDSDGNKTSTINVLHSGIPRNTMGPYEGWITMPEALILVATEMRIEEGEN